MIYAGFYLVFRGLGLTAQPANAASLLITAVANTAGHRRVTFRIRGSARAGRQQLLGLVAFGAGLGVTSAALVGLHAWTARPGRAIEVLVLITANLAATALRFVLYRYWVFRPALPASEMI